MELTKDSGDDSQAMLEARCRQMSIQLQVSRVSVSDVTGCLSGLVSGGFGASLSCGRC